MRCHFHPALAAGGGAPKNRVVLIEFSAGWVGCKNYFYIFATALKNKARVAELVDAHDSGSCLRKEVRVRLPPRALRFLEDQKIILLQTAYTTAYTRPHILIKVYSQNMPPKRKNIHKVLKYVSTKEKNDFLSWEISENTGLSLGEVNQILRFLIEVGEVHDVSHGDTPDRNEAISVKDSAYDAYE